MVKKRKPCSEVGVQAEEQETEGRPQRCTSIEEQDQTDQKKFSEHILPIEEEYYLKQEYEDFPVIERRNITD